MTFFTSSRKSKYFSSWEPIWKCKAPARRWSGSWKGRERQRLLPKARANFKPLKLQILQGSALCRCGYSRSGIPRGQPGIYALLMVRIFRHVPMRWREREERTKRSKEEEEEKRLFSSGGGKEAAFGLCPSVRSSGSNASRKTAGFGTWLGRPQAEIAHGKRNARLTCVRERLRVRLPEI